MSGRTLLVAHEGCEATPPHAIESVLAGFAAGADVVEIDLRATRDGVVVLRHDPELLVDGRTLELASMDFAELTTLERAGRIAAAGAGRLTRFEEVLELARERGGALNLDLKEDAVIDPAIRLVRERGMEELVIVSGSEQPRARIVRNRCPELPVLLDVSDRECAEGAGDPARFARELCARARTAGCAGVNVDYRYCTDELVDVAAARFVPVSVWTVNEPADQARMLGFGVHSITTHRVRALRALIDGAAPPHGVRRGG